MFESITKKITDKALKSTNKVLIDASELADLRLRAASKNKALTPAQLTQLQLGSYLPNFEELNKKDDAFKNALGQVCSNLLKSEEWKYLMNHLKQDQVNISLFTEGVKHTDNWVRGAINGIYVVDDTSQTLGHAYDDRVSKGLVPK